MKASKRALVASGKAPRIEFTLVECVVSSMRTLD